METKFEAKITAAENRIAELERRLQQETQPKEEGPWLTSLSLHNPASKLASGDHVVPCSSCEDDRVYQTQGH